MMVLDLSNFKTIFGRLESFSRSQKELGMSKCFKSFEWYWKKSCGLWKIFLLEQIILRHYYTKNEVNYEDVAHLLRSLLEWF